MKKDDLVGKIIENPSTKNCRQILDDMFKTTPHGELALLFKELGTHEEEYVRILAALGIGRLAQTREGDLEEIFNHLQRMADDWSGKVITYGLTKAMTDVFQVDGDFLLGKFRNRHPDDGKTNPTFFKVFLIAYAKYVGKTGDGEHFKKLLSIIDKHIATDNIPVQDALITAINTLGAAFIGEITAKLLEWSQLDNIFIFEVIRGVLDKSLGKKIPPGLRTDLLKRMAASEQKRIARLTESGYSSGGAVKIKYIEQVVHTLLHRIAVWFLPFNWGANPYRGCVHGCDYCYARSSHEYLGNSKEDFERVVYVKVNGANALEKDLSTPRWKKQKNKLVNLGSVTDPYQKIEEKYEITRRILEVFLAKQNPVTVTTKSDLVIRDVDLLQKLGKLTNVVFSIPTLDENLAAIIEKRAPPVTKRLAAVETLKKAGVTVGVLLIPIMPYINDNKDDLRAMVKTLADLGVDYVIPDVLNLRGDVKIKIEYFLKQYYPALIEPYKRLYTYGKKSEYADKAYLKDIFDFLMKDCLKKYGLNDYSRMIKGKW